MITATPDLLVGIFRPLPPSGARSPNDDNPNTPLRRYEAVGLPSGPNFSQSQALSNKLPRSKAREIVAINAWRDNHSADIFKTDESAANAQISVKVNIRPFMPSSRTCAMRQTRQGLMWLAMRRACLVVPVSRHHRSMGARADREMSKTGVGANPCSSNLDPAGRAEFFRLGRCEDEIKHSLPIFNKVGGIGHNRVTGGGTRHVVLEFAARAVALGLGGSQIFPINFLTGSWLMINPPRLRRLQTSLRKPFCLLASTLWPFV
jgi:hypothetical protein